MSLLSLSVKTSPPLFSLELTPKEMLEPGVFGEKHLDDCQSEFTNAKLNKNKDKNLNYFSVDTS